MKLASFIANNKSTYGVLAGDELLEPGDDFRARYPDLRAAIATGTPGGVGAARTPPRWLQSGDSVEVDIPGVGLLANPVADE